MFDFDTPLATMSDAHREWHLNSGVPMGQPGCPQDACHPVEHDEEPEPQFRCGNHGWNAHVYHHSVEDVRRCFATGSKTPAKAAPLADPGTVSERAPYGTTHVTMKPQDAVFATSNDPAMPTVVAQRVSVQEIQSWSKIPVGRGDKAYYALETHDGHVDFFQVRRSSTGKYRGKTFVDQQSGDTFDRMSFLTAAKVLSKIAVNPLAAATLYGQKIEKCGMCHHTLTDDTTKGPDGLTSLERGIGPKCAKKVGMV